MHLYSEQTAPNNDAAVSVPLCQKSLNQPLIHFKINTFNTIFYFTTFSSFNFLNFQNFTFQQFLFYKNSIIINLLFVLLKSIKLYYVPSKSNQIEIEIARRIVTINITLLT